MTAKVYKFSTIDMEFSLTIEAVIMDKILNLCRESGRLETGGILVGCYNNSHDNAIVTDISRSPSDSKRGRASFYRGVRGLQAWLHGLWSRKRIYYLGEWHYHPYADPGASSTDLAQLQAYAQTDSLHCPEPVMLIIGGDPGNSWNVKAYVSPRGRPAQEMIRANCKNLIARISGGYEWTNLV